MRQRIPTLLALILLIATVAVGIFIFVIKRNNESAQLSAINPHDIVIANISDTSASVIWHTGTPTTGKVRINNNVFTDDRDQQQIKERTTHFVTLSNLTPGTNNEFQLEINGLLYPEIPLTIKTMSRELSERALQEQTYPPIRGTVISSTGEPEEEAIIITKLPNANPKASYITTAGNFILPLTKLVNSDSTDLVTLTDNQPTTLEIRKNQQVSLVQISLPVKEQLPPVTLGKNENFIDVLTLPITTPEPLEFESREANYDLNNDGKINTLDSSLVSDLIARKQFNRNADFNNDQTIDDKDLDLIKARLE